MGIFYHFFRTVATISDNIHVLYTGRILALTRYDLINGDRFPADRLRILRTRRVGRTNNQMHAIAFASIHRRMCLMRVHFVS